MAKQTINIGTAPNDGTGTPLRTAFDYCNLNFTELYTAVGPSGNNIVVPGSATITGAATVGTTLGVTGALTCQSTASFLTGTALPLHIRNSGTSLTQIGDNATIGAGTAFIVGSSDGSLRFQGAGSELMRVNSTGLGVGVTPSAFGGGRKAIQISSPAQVVSANLTMEIGSNWWNDGTNYRYTNTNAVSLYSPSNGTHTWFIAPSGTAGNAITFTQAMTLDASGNLSLASGYVRAAARTQIGAGYIGDINIAGNNRGLFFGSTGLLPANGTGTASDNSYNLGSGTERWATVYAGTGTINTSDRNEKQDIDDLSASEKRVASSIKQLVKKYRFKDAVASKGENARIHVGWIAQDVQSAFAAEGLDASDYGMFCSDSWYEVNGSSVDSDGKPYTSESENAVAKTRLGLRHDELLAFVVSSL
jgi:hypothetical protein